MNIVVRRAGPADRAFVIKAIMESEKSGSDVVSYCALFSISESQFGEILSLILDEEIEDQELNINNFLIAEVDGIPASASSSWIESDNEIGSGVIKSTLFSTFLGKSIFFAAAESMNVLNEVSIPREAGALQVECIYTEPAFRGMGLAAQLIIEHERLYKTKGRHFSKIQIILLDNNAAAIKSYEKAGLKTVLRKRTENNKIFNILPSDTKLLMEKNVLN